MKRIYSAELTAFDTIDMDGEKYEYQMEERSEAETDYQSAIDYVNEFLLDQADGLEIVEDAIIKDAPSGAVVVGYDGKSQEIYWAE